MPTNEKDNDFFIANRRFLSKEQIALIEAFHYQLKNSPQFRQGLLLNFYCLKITNRYWPLSDGELMKKVFTGPENKKKAFELYQKSAEAGYAPAMEKLAQMYEKDEHVKPDAEKKEYWHRQAELHKDEKPPEHEFNFYFRKKYSL